MDDFETYKKNMAELYRQVDGERNDLRSELNRLKAQVDPLVERATVYQETLEEVLSHIMLPHQIGKDRLDIECNMAVGKIQRVLNMYRPSLPTDDTSNESEPKRD
jgi:hypothetical protein